MLRIASRQAAQRLIKQWLREEPTPRLHEVEAETLGLLQEPNWQPDAIATRVEQVATEGTEEGTPVQMVEAFLSQLAQQGETAFARNEPSNWCRDALQRMREWAGGAGTASPGNEWQRSKLDRLYLDSAEKVANEYAANLNRPARRLFNSPGDRMAIAEAAYESLALKLQAIVENYQAEVVKQQNVSASSHQKVSVALEETLAGVRSFSFFPAKRMQKLLERFTETVTKFCRDRLAEYTIRSVELVYRTLLGRISELQRDLKFCSQRLKHLEHSLMTAGSEQDLTSASMETLGAKPSGFSSSQMSSSQVLRDAAMVLASRIVLPDGQSDLEHAATKFLASVPHAAWSERPLHPVHEQQRSSTCLERPAAAGHRDLSEQAPGSDRCLPGGTFHRPGAQGGSWRSDQSVPSLGDPQHRFQKQPGTGKRLPARAQYRSRQGIH
jgi:hypothetical protein